MRSSLSLTIGALCLLGEVASSEAFDRRAATVRRGSWNVTALIVPPPARDTASISACTATITSIVGQPSVESPGPCHWTITVTSNPPAAPSSTTENSVSPTSNTQSPKDSSHWVAPASSSLETTTLHPTPPIASLNEPSPHWTSESLPLPTPSSSVESQPGMSKSPATSEPAQTRGPETSVEEVTTRTSQPQILSPEPSSSTTEPSSVPTLTLTSISSPLATSTSELESTTTPPPAPVLFGSQTITQDFSSNFIIGSFTLIPGSDTTIDGQHVSAAPSGGAIIINGAPPPSSTSTTSPDLSTTPTPPATSSSSTKSAPGKVIIHSTTITQGPSSGFVIGTQTLYPGSAITEGGEVITLPLPKPTEITQPAVVIGSGSSVLTISTNSASEYLVGSQTLRPGSAVTVNGQTVSLSPTGSAIILNPPSPSNATISPNSPTSSSPTYSNSAVTSSVPSTLITSTSTKNSPDLPFTSLLVAGQILTAGGVVTVGGDVLSLAPSGTAVVVVGTVTLGGGEASSVSATGSPMATRNANIGARIGGGLWAIGGALAIMGLGIMI